MKIRKILPLLAIGLVAMFFLAGCDQILENLFPKDTGHDTNSGNNSVMINAFLWTDQDKVTSPWFGEVHIDLMDATGTTVVKSTSDWAYSYDTYYYDDYPYYTYLYYYRYPVTGSFNFIPDGTYKIRVWYDANYNGQYDSGRVQARRVSARTQ
jgi:hypothetical protein